VPEDRFGDLGESRPRKPASGTRAGRELADLDRADEERTPPRPRPRQPGQRYMWVVGVAAVIAIAAAGINSLPHAGRGLSGPTAGKPLPKFAAPTATGPHTDAEPNTKQSAADDGSGAKVPACEITVPGALRICDYETKPLVIAFIVPGAPDCEKFGDRLQQLKPRYPGVNFVGVVSGVDQGRVRSLVQDHGWTFPVAVDHNLAVFNTYRVAVCATTVFAYKGGLVRATKIEAQKYDDAQLNAAIRAITKR
jgi:peroxiredoxin